MVTILLEKILTLLTGWLNAFTEHATNVLAKLNLIEEDTSNLPDIKTNTDSIVSNTASVITPINNIKSNTDSIKTNTDSIKADTTIIKNNISTISTNTGTTSAFCEDIANNTLDIDTRVVTIGSDTTQLRTNSNTITSDVHDIKDALQYYFLNTFVTEDSEGSICNFDTDLKEYLQEAKITIPADAGGISEAKVGYVDFNQKLPVSTHSTSTSNQNDWVNVGTQSITYIPGHVYYLITTINKSDNCNVRFRYPIINTLQNGINKFITNIPNGVYVGYQIRSTDGENATCDMDNEQLIDVTQLFGSTVADYLYSLSDKGMSILSAIFSKNYYSYNVGGSLVSVASVNSSYYPNASVSFGTSITDGGELDLLTGLIRVNSTPPSIIQVDPVAIRTLKGLNSIWSNVGNMSVTYRETLKHYLDKQNQ